MNIGIFFGGASREREISFAGGRTVYDNLDRNLFTPVPVFVDSFNTLVELRWQYIYKGSIKDFFPTADILPPSERFDLPVYIEQIETLNKEIYRTALQRIGTQIPFSELNEKIQAAFLTLHGIFGEDGRLQGALEWFRIPYTGSGIYPSALGIDKIKQRRVMKAFGFATPKYLVVSHNEVLKNPENVKNLVRKTVEFPCVIKHPLQGSSIGVQIVRSPEEFREKLLAASFIKKISAEEWHSLSEEEKKKRILKISDLQESVGLPAFVYEDENEKEIIRHPDWLYLRLEKAKKEVTLIAIDAPPEILIEEFIEGEEFSAIVLERPDGEAFCLPPTQILKKKNVYDYQSKYLPGIVSKLTPMNAPAPVLKKIKKEAERLYKTLEFEVYARLDGIISKEGIVYFNDPNTTSGMLPSSFFFHQAAEIGLEPKDLITHIILRSLQVRGKTYSLRSRRYAEELEAKIKEQRSTKAVLTKTRVGVFLGGYSSERHISVESGRNVYQKLSASSEYLPVPIFVMKNALFPAELREKFAEQGKEYSFWKLPINLLLKDNADDIARSIVAFASGEKEEKILEEFIAPFEELLRFYNLNPLRNPEYISFEQLSGQIDFAFITVHGRPGEDGDMQSLFENLGIPYNGSSPEPSAIAMDKFATKKKLKEGGFQVAKGINIYKQQWLEDAEQVLYEVEKNIGFPVIAKPADEGCSTGVVKIENSEDLKTYFEAAFRDTLVIKPSLQQKLKELGTEHLPRFSSVLVEEFIYPREGEKLVEVTVGFLSHKLGNKTTYEVFEPSETIAEEGILSLEEKFLAGEGQNITPARLHPNPEVNKTLLEKVKAEILKVIEYLQLEGYARIDAFVRIKPDLSIEVIIIEVNSLPGLTPATCIFHQAALNEYTPLDFLSEIIKYGMAARK